MAEATFSNRCSLRVLAALALGVFSSGPALADDWKIASMEGDVLVFCHGQWNPLRQGDIVADDAVIRSLSNGSALFTRDRERILVAPDTQIQIVDRVGQRYTTIVQRFGAVGIEANVENVRHFEVRTPFLAAVVKGTIFGVHTDSRGSDVSVQRGTVGVAPSNGRGHVDVHVGQSAVQGASGAPYVSAVSSGGAASSAAAAAAAGASLPSYSPSPSNSSSQNPAAASQGTSLASILSDSDTKTAASNSDGASAGQGGGGGGGGSLGSGNGGSGNGGSGGWGGQGSGGWGGRGFGGGGSGYRPNAYNASNGNGLGHMNTASQGNANASGGAGGGAAAESAKQAAAAKYLANIKALLSKLSTSHKTKTNGRL